MIAPPRPSTLSLTIPGTPHAQGRGRAVRFGASVRIVDPTASRSWKGAAQVHMLQARQAAGLYGPLDGALVVTVGAFFPRPKALAKKPDVWRPSRPDCDNIGKACLDAGNGVLWADDAQVVRLVVEKRYAAAGDGPRVELVVLPAEAS